jgi:hypothetical protein
MPLRGLPAYAAVGVLAALTQTAFLLYFSAPLAESLHDKLVAAEEEEETAYWAVPLAAVLYGAAAGVIFGLVAERIEPATAALLFFIGYSALPTLKWLPTPHGVSYLEPVWWREAVYGLYLLYNMAAVLASFIFIRRGVLKVVVAAVALVAGFFLFPGFTLPEKYVSVVPELKALQGLALASWALFWTVMAVGGRLVMPIKRVQRGASP